MSKKVEIKEYTLKGQGHSKLEGKWFVVCTDLTSPSRHYRYLHTDGVWRNTAKNHVTQEYTGYFNSKQEAEDMLAKSRGGIENDTQ